MTSCDHFHRGVSVQDCSRACESSLLSCSACVQIRCRTYIWWRQRWGGRRRRGLSRMGKRVEWGSWRRSELSLPDRLARLSTVMSKVCRWAVNMTSIFTFVQLLIEDYKNVTAAENNNPPYKSQESSKCFQNVGIGGSRLTDGGAQFSVA